MPTVRAAEAKRPLRRPLSATLLAASLAVTACGGLAAAGPAMWHAVSSLHQSPTSGPAAVAASAGRDQPGKPALDHPAKGAMRRL
jgi:hypothetical protein